MSRPRSPIERREVRVTLPLDLVTRFELSQTSPTDGVRPQGVWQDLFTRALREHFDYQTLDLSPWAGAPKGSTLVKGHPVVLKLLQDLLNTRYLASGEAWPLTEEAKELLP